MIHCSNQSRRPDWPLTKTSKTRELDSKEENQPDEQQV